MKSGMIVLGADYLDAKNAGRRHPESGWPGGLPSGNDCCSIAAMRCFCCSLSCATTIYACRSPASDPGAMPPRAGQLNNRVIARSASFMMTQHPPRAFRTPFGGISLPKRLSP